MTQFKPSDILVSLEIETGGPNVLRHPLFSLGAVAFNPFTREEVSRFYVNLIERPGTAPDPATMQWWERNKEALARARENPQPLETAFPAFVAWLKALGGRVIGMAYPAQFEGGWIRPYCLEYAGDDPLWLEYVCLATLAGQKLGRLPHDVGKRSFPSAWMESLPPHTHVADEDALEQGVLFFRVDETPDGLNWVLGQSGRYELAV